MGALWYSEIKSICQQGKVDVSSLSKKVNAQWMKGVEVM